MKKARVGISIGIIACSNLTAKPGNLAFLGEINSIKSFRFNKKRSMEQEEDTKPSDIKRELLSMWSIQDSLLQSYRGLFLSSQSIIFSVAAIVVSSEKL